jgi:hypothetical protein
VSEGGSQGISARALVPPAGGLEIRRRPPSASMRSARPLSPDAAAGSAPPTPSSATSTVVNDLARARALDPCGRDHDVRRPELGIDALHEGTDGTTVRDVEVGVQDGPIRRHEVAACDREPIGRQPIDDRVPNPPLAPETIAARSAIAEPTLRLSTTAVERARSPG